LRRGGPELTHFKSFLAAQGASLDLLCWEDIEAWRGERDEGAREARALEIKDVYLNEQYFFGPHSPAGKQGQQKVRFWEKRFVSACADSAFCAEKCFSW
jgi:hypothetical protein